MIGNLRGIQMSQAMKDSMISDLECAIKIINENPDSLFMYNHSHEWINTIMREEVISIPKPVGDDDLNLMTHKDLKPIVEEMLRFVKSEDCSSAFISDTYQSQYWCSLSNSINFEYRPEWENSLVGSIRRPGVNYPE